MAFMRQCCCCCDLRTGVMLIGIFSIIGCGINIVNEVRSLVQLPEAREYLAKHPVDTEKYGFTLEVLDGLEVANKIAIAMSAVSLLSAILLLIPACHTVRQEARRFRTLLFGWIGWNIVGILFALGFGAWILAKFNNPIVAAALVVGFGLSIPLGIYFIVVVAAFYIELGEEPHQMAGVVVQSSVPYSNFQNQPPPPYAPGGQEYPAKVGMV